MTKVVAGMSVSLDGFIASPNGDDLGLHNWVFKGKVPVDTAGITFHLASENSATFFKESVQNMGAVIIGSRAFRVADNNPIFGVPTFVLTHKTRDAVIKEGVTVSFINDGIQSALAQAKAAGGEKNVYIFGGANTVQQFLNAGLLEVLQLDLVPVFIGQGIRLFDQLGANLKLEQVRVIASVNVTHLEYRVVT